MTMIRRIHSRVRLGLYRSVAPSSRVATDHTIGRRRLSTFPPRSINFQPSTTCSAITSLSSSLQPSRAFWSSPQEDNDQSPSSSNTPLLPVSPITPSNIAATSLLSDSTITSLQSLPEIKAALDILYHQPSSVTTSQQLQQLHTDLDRSREILQSIPQLHSATFLLSTDLYTLSGQYDSAIDSLARYTHSTQQEVTLQTKLHLQFLKAKLFLLSGQFTLALSEYEDLMEGMEERVQRQMQQQQQKQQQKQDVESGISVIDGAATLTGVGLSKLLLTLHTETTNNNNNNTEQINQEIMEAIETSTEMLLESRNDAIHSPQHATTAIDLGIAASISLTNQGILHCTLQSNNKNNKVKSIELWKQALNNLDTVLSDAMNTATIIPRHKFIWMESIRARLYCNIASLLLGLETEPTNMEKKKKKKLEEETLKHASEAAKKGLDIYDELINGAKILRGEGDGGGGAVDDASGGEGDEDENAKEWERILKEEVEKKQENEDQNEKPPEVALSPLWVDYHRCESARALGLVAHCYAQAGAAVTSEGLFQSALDASTSYPFGQKLRSTNSNVVVVDDGKGIAKSSPNLGLIARDVRLWYALLCNNWEKRKGDADRLLADTELIDRDMVFPGFVNKDEKEEEEKRRISGMISSLWLFSPADFEK